MRHHSLPNAMTYTEAISLTAANDVLMTGDIPGTGRTLLRWRGTAWTAEPDPTGGESLKDPWYRGRATPGS